MNTVQDMIKKIKLVKRLTNKPENKNFYVTGTFVSHWIAYCFHMMKCHKLECFIDPFDIGNIYIALEHPHSFVEFSEGPLTFHIDSFQAFEKEIDFTYCNEYCHGLKCYIVDGIEIIAMDSSASKCLPSKYSECLMFSLMGLSVRDRVPNSFGHESHEEWNTDSSVVINGAIDKIFPLCSIKTGIF